MSLDYWLEVKYWFVGKYRDGDEYRFEKVLFVVCKDFLVVVN